MGCTCWGPSPLPGVKGIADVCRMDPGGVRRVYWEALVPDRGVPVPLSQPPENGGVQVLCCVSPRSTTGLVA